MTRTFLAAVTAVALLAACGGEKPAASADHGADKLANGMTVKEQIDARKKSLKEMGASFKGINDTLKTDAPQLEQIRSGATVINGHAQEIGTWFPEGTGPESGVETEAKAEIWSDRATFDAAVTRLQDEAGKLTTVAAGDDVAAIQAQAQATGGACKNCHDTFRKKKE